MNKDTLKKAAAEKAVEEIESGMTIGLGTGSTAYFAIIKIAELIKEGRLKNIKAIPTSKQTEELARENNIPLTTFAESSCIDITIDGADEVDRKLNLIKGGGGALLREKVVAQSTKKNIIVVDESKLSENLGDNFFVPVEVLEYALEPEKKFLQELGALVKIRRDIENKIFKTDENNIILDCTFGSINEPADLNKQLNERAGIVGHGLFIELASKVIVASEEKGIFTLENK
ncbi:MAG: ribose-5-phosphate isomerase RpiA [Melioribacteraceae bacterium]|nr:ribose-5-phosphate isomerase RpiA [Melioribacteraceae bacterium]